MPETVIARDRINGWEKIAHYVGCDVTTAIRRAKAGTLPVHQPSGRRGAVHAYRYELDAWLAASYRSKEGVNGDGRRRGRQAAFSSSSSSPSAIAEEAPPEAAEWHPYTQAQPIRIWVRQYARGLRWTMAALAFLAAGVFAVYSLTTPRRIQFTGIAQLTNDGTQKVGLVTDGEHLYFGENRGGKVVLSEVSVAGGPVRSIPTPFIDANPESISPDGKQLLVLDREGEEEERALWIVPTEGGAPRRVGRVFCHSAVWSPDGGRIAYATGNGIYLTFDEGATVQRVQTVAGVPKLLRWSLNGKRLRFNLGEEDTGRSFLWELVFRGEGTSQVASLVQLHVALNQHLTSLVMSDNTGRSFISIDRPLDNKIWYLEMSWGLSGPRFIPVELRDQLANISALALDRSTRTVFALSGGTGGSELLRFNATTRGFSPFLPGVAAKDVNFSRDGRRIAFVGSQGKSLWISNADGSQKRQVDFQATEIELPRWSPDGQWIAFMAKLPDRPWRIFLVPAGGGDPKEASAGTDNQGAPTWSPDGRWLMYGNVKCEEFGTCAIHKIDLATGQVLTLPGSEGMGTARWSPDGRFVAALFPERQEVYVLDLATGRWRKLADGVNGNDLNWSADSRYIYAGRPIGDKPEILRMSLSNGRVDSAVDLSAFSKLAGRVDTWFGIAPDGSIIFMRWLDQTEVYALYYQEM